MTESGEDTRSIEIAIASFFALLALQLVAYLMTNFQALLAEVYMEIGEILVSAFLLLSVYWSRKPADQFHMFSHGRAQNVAARVSAIIIVIFLSTETLRSSLPKLIRGSEVEFQNPTLALSVVVAAIIISAFPLVNIVRKRTKGSALKAQLWGVVIEEIASVSAFIGILLATIGYPWADAVASLVIGVIIAAIGANLFRENVHYLIGKTPGKDFLEKVQSATMSVDGVIGIHDLKAELVGPNIIHADFCIDVAGNISVRDADIIVRFVLAVGSPSEEIVNIAQNEGAGLIIMGSRQLGTKEKIKVLGSVARRVSEIAPCPVMLVH